MNIETLAKKMVQAARTIPSRNFGNWFMEVDHAELGEQAKVFRLTKNVRAVDVARFLNLNRGRICCLETGRKAWDSAVLMQYLKAVKALARKK